MEEKVGDTMKLVIKKSDQLGPLFPKAAEPVLVEEKAQNYGWKKLGEWEQRYSEILILLNKSNNQEGIKHLFELAEEGYPEARWLLSDMYLEGRGLPESFQKAVEWDRRAQFAERLFRDKWIND
jgi:TPR repeat protein